MTASEESSDNDLLPRNWSNAQLQIKQLIAENKRLKEGDAKQIEEVMKGKYMNLFSYSLFMLG